MSKKEEINYFPGVVETADTNELVEEYYADCAVYMFTYRFAPNILDGLKPSYRRLLFCGKEVCPSTGSLKKSAAIIGNTLIYHPHGDSALYTSLVSMASPSSVVPLFHKKGNFGTATESAAHYRYTEVKLNEISDLNHLNIMEFSDMEMGESGNKEPLALPTLIPYNLLAGAFGIGIGLRVNTMPLDALELIDYFMAKLKGEEAKVPTPDIGNCILNMTDKDIDEAVLSPICNIKTKPILTRESETIVSMDGLPRSSTKSIESVISNINKSMDDVINSGKIDFRDESKTDFRYVFEIMDKSISMSEFVKVLEKAASCNIQFNRLVYDKDDNDKERAIYCSLEKQADLSLSYLKKCLERKRQKDLVRLGKERNVLLAVKHIKDSGLVRKLEKMSRKDLFDALEKAGFDPDVARSAAGKPITYLTTSHDCELTDNTSKIKEAKVRDLSEIILKEYEKLKELILPIYNKKKHSIRKSKMLKSPKVSFKKKTIIISNRGMEFGEKIIAILQNGDAVPVMAGAAIRKEIELEISYNILGIATDAYSAFAAITTLGNLVVRKIDSFKERKPIANFSENELIYQAFPLVSKGNKLIGELDGISYDFAPFLKSRISIPVSNWKNKIESLPN